MRDAMTIYIALQVIVQLCIHFALLIVWGMKSLGL
jgi:hypothetical protein